jgi:hypothetical protein
MRKSVNAVVKIRRKIVAVKVLTGVLGALIIRDFITWYAEKLNWQMSVNRHFPKTPIKIQVIRALAKDKPKYGDG